MMYEEDIQKVDEWFDAHTEYYGTSRSEREYSIDSYDLDDFTKFLSDEFPDLCYIRCHLGTGNSTIWFFRDDLEKAEPQTDCPKTCPSRDICTKSDADCAWK